MYKLISRIKGTIACIEYSLHCLSARRKISKLLPTKYLESGKYDVALCGRYFLVKKGLSENKEQKMGLTTRKSYLMSLINNPSCQSPICGQIMMITANSVRFFNFDKCMTFTQYTTEEEAKKIINAGERFEGIFNSTKIKIENNCVIEKFIEYKPREKWSEAEIINNYYSLMEKYIDYLKKESNNGTRINYLNHQLPWIEQNPSKEFISLYKRLSNDIVKCPFTTFVFCHCDFHFGNTLFSDNDIYLIDFEYCREEVFYYDIFNVMYVEFVSKKNSKLLDLYLSGDKKTMSFIIRCFNAMHIEYDIKYKLLYFEIFLMSRLIFSCYKRPLKTKKSNELSNRIKINVGYIQSVLDYIQAANY